MYHRILVGLIALSATINYIGAMEPWLAAGTSARSARKAATPAQQIDAKQKELESIQKQLQTASGPRRTDLLNRQQQLQKEIETLKQAKNVQLPTE